MRFIFVLCAAAVSVLIMFLIAKLIGYRQISELSMYDYINSITLGSIAADLAIAPEWDEAVYCVIGMVVYGAFTLIFSYASMKSKSARNLFVGPPIVLMEGGKIYKNSFKKANLDLDEFLSMCRSSGYFDPAKIDTVIMEPMGKISVIPKSSERPLTTKDMNVTAEREEITANVIMDGKVLPTHLKQIGLDENWLKNELKNQGAEPVEDIFLATVDSNKQLTVFKMENKQNDNPL